MPLLFLIGENIFTIKHKIYLHNDLSISTIALNFPPKFWAFFHFERREMALWIL